MTSNILLCLLCVTLLFHLSEGQQFPEDAECRREHGVCTRQVYMNTRLAALRKSGCRHFCQCAHASTEIDGSVTYKWVRQTCPPNTLFNDGLDAPVCDHAKKVKCQGDANDDDDCRHEHGTCTQFIYENVRLVAQKSSGCKKFCQCAHASTQLDGSVTYKWVEQTCPQGTLFDNTARVCNHEQNVQCNGNGGWSSWSAWSNCPVTCGSATVTRSRSCEGAAPSGGEAACPGSSSESKTCTKTACPKTCAEVYSSASTPPSSGIYTLANANDELFTVYCLFKSEYGYTFISPSINVDPNLAELFTERSEVLIRHKRTSEYQYDATVGQISRYSNQPIGVLYNSYTGYNQLQNGHMSPYLYVGFVPKDGVSHFHDTQGWNVQGKDYTFRNCDGNPNSYFALLYNHQRKPYGNYRHPKTNLLWVWYDQATSASEDDYIPDSFFTSQYEIHHGGCGGYQISTSFTDVVGVSIGLRFSIDKDECLNEYGYCSRDQYENVRLVALRSSGCKHFCQCAHASTQIDGSVTYRWVKKTCPDGTLFDESLPAPVCNHDYEVQCPDDESGDCTKEHGVCTESIYEDVRLVPKRSSGCKKFCQCAYASTELDGSVTYKWVEHDCPAGTLFDKISRVCIYAKDVDCGGNSGQDTTPWLVQTTTSSQVVNDGECFKEYSYCSRNQYENVRLVALRSSGCKDFCQCAHASTQIDGSVTYKWVKKTCPDGTLFDESLSEPVCNHDYEVQCPNDASGDCTAEHGTCTLEEYEHKRLTALRSSGCKKFCQCAHASTQLDGSVTYYWVDQICPQETLFDEDALVCNYADKVQC